VTGVSPLHARLFGELVLVSGIGATMLWLALRTWLIEERQDVRRCAACGRLLRAGEPCRCSRDS
jgi:hypothetical protein